MAPHCRLTERIRAFIATCLAWSPNLPCDYKGLQLVGELLSLGGETLKQPVGDLHERQLWVSRVQSPSLPPSSYSCPCWATPSAARRAPSNCPVRQCNPWVVSSSSWARARVPRSAPRHTPALRPKAPPNHGVSAATETPRSGQCPPGGDCVTHLIGASQSHRDRGGQHIDDVSSPLTETAPSGRGHGTPRKMLAASIIGSSSTH